MHDKITSTGNPRIKEIVKLKEHSARKKSGLILVEGHREITRALESNVHLKEFFMCKDMIKTFEQRELIKKISLLGTPTIETFKDVYQKISYGERQEGLLAVCKANIFSLNDLPQKENLLFVVVEDVEKPGNLGAILRTADAAGVDGVIVCDLKTDVYNPNVIRSSLGTVFTNKIVVTSKDTAFQFLKSHQVTSVASTPSAPLSYTHANFNRSIAVIMGSEQNGLSDFWLKKASVQVKIPMKGKADSLNVSASTAVLLYEILRQRGT